MDDDCCAELIFRLSESTKEKRRGKLQRRILLIYDDAPIYTTQLSERAV
jgi:hypothetical protein